MTENGTLFVICAPSGGGKTSLIKGILDTVSGIEVSISHTTRPIRPKEQEGQHYFFVTSETFDEMVSEDAFIEHAEVYEHAYGTSKQQISDRLARGVDVLLDIDWQGAKQISSFFHDVVTIFILPPSLESLKQRLSSRGQDAEQTIARRMLKAQAEMSHYDEFDYLVINDEFEQALSEISKIVISGRLKRVKQQQKHAKLLSKLLA